MTGSPSAARAAVQLPAEHTRTTIALFDLDRTLLPGSSLVGLAKALAASTIGSRRSPGRAAVLQLARGIGAELADTITPGARMLLSRHLAAGDFCVLLSAGPQELVEAVCGAVGAHRAIGTRGEVRADRFTGRLDGPLCYGKGKVARLQQALGKVDLSGAWAYADSASDLPLLEACGHPVAVNPDRRLRTIAAARRWPIVDVH
jgi:phosphoserine phosphatase